jgi:hypothetical protein
MSLFSIVRSAARRINNDRTLRDILNHMKSEVKELDEEIAKDEAGELAGSDGIVGEAIDIIQCAMDVILTHRPYLTEAQLEAIMDTKCEKWVRYYANSIQKATDVPDEG